MRVENDRHPLPPEQAPERLPHCTMKAWLKTATQDSTGKVNLPAGVHENEVKERRRTTFSTFFHAEFNMAALQHKGAGRPSGECKTREAQRGAFAQGYATSVAPTPEEWFRGEAYKDEVASICDKKGWSVEVLLAASLSAKTGAAAADAARANNSAMDDAEEGDGADEANDAEGLEQAKHHYTNPAVFMLYQSYMHVWCVKGTHVRFRNAKEFLAEIKAHLGHVVNDKTAARWLKKEKDRFNADKATHPEAYAAAMRKKPDVTAMLADITDARKEMQTFNASDPPNVRHNGRPFTFDTSLYPLLIEKCEKALPLPGFGTDLVAAYASLIHANANKVTVEDDSDVAPDSDVAELWVPSESWCFWFMRKKMKLSFRRVTGAPVLSAKETAKQEELHKRTVQHIAVALHQGLHPKFIIRSDEFGMHLFPHSKWRWAKEGDKNVTSALKVSLPPIISTPLQAPQALLFLPKHPH